MLATFQRTKRLTLGSSSPVGMRVRAHEAKRTLDKVRLGPSLSLLRVLLQGGLPLPEPVPGYQVLSLAGTRFCQQCL